MKRPHFVSRSAWWRMSRTERRLGWFVAMCFRMGVCTQAEVDAVWATPVQRMPDGTYVVEMGGERG